MTHGHPRCADYTPAAFFRFLADAQIAELDDRVARLVDARYAEAKDEAYRAHVKDLQMRRNRVEAQRYGGRRPRVRRHDDGLS